MDLDQFILKQIIRQDVRYIPDSCRFEHPSLDLSDRKQVIFDEGRMQGYSDECIQHTIYTVINSLHRFRQRRERSISVSIGLNGFQYLPLGGIVAISASTPNQQDCLLQLLRIGLEKFVVVKSSNSELFRPAYEYSLVNADYLSTINGATFTFHSEEVKKNSVISQIHNLSIVHPSYVELTLDEEKCNECNRTYILHKNPMLVLLHEYSQKLSNYIDLEVHQNICPVSSNCSFDDLYSFVKQLKASVQCCSSVAEIENYYLQWFGYCHANGVSVMTLDTLLNLFWQQKINAYKNNSDIKHG